jgi:hypothetical protein
VWEEWEAELYGFPCFPHSVISMVCLCSGACGRALAGMNLSSVALNSPSSISRKLDTEDILVDLFETEVFKGDDLADERTALVPADVATPVDTSYLEAFRIVER